MRTSMTHPIRFWALVPGFLLVYQFSTEASADWCKYEKEIDLTLDVSASEILAISAAAGDLDLIGVSDSRKATIRGKACASKEAWLEDSGMSTLAGKRAEITVNLPTTNGGWSLFGSSYVRLDLHIRVPQNLALEIKDSSGDFRVLKDGSGGIRSNNVSGEIKLPQKG